MTVTKEFLESLDVVSLSVAKQGRGSLCCLRKVNGRKLTLSVLNKIDCEKDEALELKFVFKRDTKNIVGSVEARVKNFGEDYIVLLVGNEITDGNVRMFFERLAFLEWQDEQYGRRQEERIPVGKTNFERFGLTTPEQTLFVSGIKLMQPCAVLDVSFHGIKVITPLTNPQFKNVDNFNIKISFVKPDCTIVLQAHKVHAKLDKKDGKVFATVSCQLLEPIHHSWKGRVINLMESVHSWA